MKKSITLCLSALLVVMSTNMGCIKTGDNNIVTPKLPNVANFSLQSVGTFVKGASTLITLASSTLGDGTFNVNYSISGVNNLVNQVASIAMSGGVGSFSTPVLNNSGDNTITINSISNSSGSSMVTSGNTQKFFDSTGLMTASVSGVSGGPTSFRATFIQASLAGSMLTVHGVMWTPWLTTVTLHIDNYTHTTGTTQFNSNDLSTTSVTSTFNGGASYGVSGNGIAISELSEHGIVTITSTGPVLTGTFSYTNSDSSMINSGSFSCPAP